MNEWSSGQSAAMWSLPLLPLFYAMGALLLPHVSLAGRAWAGALTIAVMTVMLTCVGVAGLALGGATVDTISLVSVVALDVGLNLLTVLMTGLISFISLIILQYAQQYLNGDPGELRFIRWFLATVASVSLLVISNHLLVIALGWIGASLCLHQLLTFYKERPQAVLAAHKKFLLSRLADACLIIGFLLVGRQYETFRLNEILALVKVQNGVLPLAVQAATVLVAFAAILKCAQLPFHGWLIQVMEAPTPVSALLHAGIVNIGGFLLIRLAPLMSVSPMAQWLLVVVGSLTAVIAGLVMMTRISVKVMLAWSTCAQMGFMLMECGLGAYALALLHLLAHSLYKAHSFLSAGCAVEYSIKRRLAPALPVHGLTGWVTAVVLGVGTVAGAATLFGSSPSHEPALWALAGIVSVGVSTLIGESLAMRNGWVTLLMASSGLGISLLYFAWHQVFVKWLALPAASSVPFAGTVAWVLAVFTIQFSLYATSRILPEHPLISRVQVYLYHGLYLDEIFTRLTLFIWPPQLTRSASSPVVAVPTCEREGALS